MLTGSQLQSDDKIVISVSTSGCRGQTNEIRYLEHVQLLLDMTYSRRGDLQVDLTSPSGKPRFDNCRDRDFESLLLGSIYDMKVNESFVVVTSGMRASWL